MVCGGLWMVFSDAYIIIRSVFCFFLCFFAEKIGGMENLLYLCTVNIVEYVHTATGLFRCGVYDFMIFIAFIMNVFLVPVRVLIHEVI